MSKEERVGHYIWRDLSNVPYQRGIVTKQDLLDIQKHNSDVLDNLMNNTELIEKLAKEEYGDNWRVIYAFERHPKSQQSLIQINNMHKKVNNERKEKREKKRRERQLDKNH